MPGWAVRTSPLQATGVAECVGKAPGGPTHVLLSDRRRSTSPDATWPSAACLEAIGGFDPRFRVAGDDVDICWRLQATGGSWGSARRRWYGTTAATPYSLLASSNVLRQGRGDTEGEMAGEVQRRRPPPLGRANLRRGACARGPVGVGNESIRAPGAAHRFSPFTSPPRTGSGGYLQRPSGMR